MVITIWSMMFYVFWSVGSSAAILNTESQPNLIEKLLGRVSIVGAGLIALVSGFGSATAPHHYFCATFQ